MATSRNKIAPSTAATVAGAMASAGDVNKLTVQMADYFNHNKEGVLFWVGNTGAPFKTLAAAGQHAINVGKQGKPNIIVSYTAAQAKEVLTAQAEAGNDDAGVVAAQVALDEATTAATTAKKQSDTDTADMNTAKAALDKAAGGNDQAAISAAEQAYNGSVIKATASTNASNTALAALTMAQNTLTAAIAKAKTAAATTNAPAQNKVKKAVKLMRRNGQVIRLGALPKK